MSGITAYMCVLYYREDFRSTRTCQVKSLWIPPIQDKTGLQMHLYGEKVIIQRTTSIPNLPWDSDDDHPWTGKTWDDVEKTPVSLSQQDVDAAHLCMNAKERFNESCQMMKKRLLECVLLKWPCTYARVHLHNRHGGTRGWMVSFPQTRRTRGDIWTWWCGTLLSDDCTSWQR